MFSDEDVANVRHVVQKILVPCVFVVGLLGNSVSIYVLTRKRMRCTTNIYLTALAITDIIYLTMAFLLSLKHYKSVQLYWKYYWDCYGLMVWLCDASAYNSIYIAVCFTIERFIAIRYPLKRQTFCTETLAKRVIIGVMIFCFLSTISTAFEHDYVRETRFEDNNGKPCLKRANQAEILGNNWKTAKTYDESKAQSILDESLATTYIPNLGTNLPQLSNHDYPLKANIQEAPWKLDKINQEMSHCKNESYFKIIETSLGKDSVYKDVWYLFTLFVFVLIPLCLLATFNCFLIMLVRASTNLRGEMTNANSIRRTKKGKANNSSVSQENRVTVTLIAVVLLFIVCQLPWAIYLIVAENVEIDYNSQAIIGNIFNFLTAINAAANFFLYCVLSDKYRKTVRNMILGYKYSAQGSIQTQPSFYGSSLSANGCSQRRQNVSSSPAPLFIK